MNVGLERVRVLDQVFAVKMDCKKYHAIGRMFFGPVWIRKMHLIQIYGYIMWQTLRECGIGGKLLKAGQSFYIDGIARVRVRMDVSEWFPVYFELRLFLLRLHNCSMYI